MGNVFSSECISLEAFVFRIHCDEVLLSFYIASLA